MKTKTELISTGENISIRLEFNWNFNQKERLTSKSSNYGLIPKNRKEWNLLMDDGGTFEKNGANEEVQSLVWNDLENNAFIPFRLKLLNIIGFENMMIHYYDSKSDGFFFCSDEDVYQEFEKGEEYKLFHTGMNNGGGYSFFFYLKREDSVNETIKKLKDFLISEYSDSLIQITAKYSETIELKVIEPKFESVLYCCGENETIEDQEEDE